jgi:magnesium chelatase family protein
VLFMDEMPEFDRGVLEALRQPLEDGVISVARVQATLDFPAETILIGAMNPSPHGQEETGIAAERYRRKISAPLLDRIDLHLSVPKLNPEELGDKPGNEDSATIRARVVAARERQTERFGRPQVNAKMSPRELRELIGLDEQARDFMRMVAAKMNLSARVYDRVLKVGRTIADLNGDPEVKKNHLAEAVQYRGGFA